MLMGDGTALRLSEINELPDTLFAGVEMESFGYLAQRKGAAAVLSTLWPVNDRSTATLMGRFYGSLSMGKGEALRRAQVALLTGQDKPALLRRGLTPGQVPKGFTAPAFVPDSKAPCAHPFYWAPFTLLGNPR